MNAEERLGRIAESYKRQGYQVVVRPGADVLPPFARDFKVEILATRADGNVLASAKKDGLELEADPDVPGYAEITGKQDGWRFDLFVLGPPPPVRPNFREAREPFEAEVWEGFDEAERLLQAGFVNPALTAAWAALESATRARTRALGERAGGGACSITTLGELYSAGGLSMAEFQNLQGLLQVRRMLTHGFVAPAAVEPGAVRFVLDTARRLLEESRPAKQSA